MPKKANMGNKQTKKMKKTAQYLKVEIKQINSTEREEILKMQNVAKQTGATYVSITTEYKR